MWHTRVLQRSRTNKIYRYIEIKIYFKDLDHMIVGVDKYEICRSAIGLETQDKVKVAVLRPKTVSRQNSFLPGVFHFSL